MLSILTGLALLSGALAAPDSLTSRYCFGDINCVAINATFDDTYIDLQHQYYATSRFRQSYSYEEYYDPSFPYQNVLPSSPPTTLQVAGTHRGKIEFTPIANEPIKDHKGNYTSLNTLGAIRAFDWGCIGFSEDAAGSYASNCTMQLTAHWHDLLGNNHTFLFPLHYTPINGQVLDGPPYTDIVNASLKHVEFNQVLRSGGVVPALVDSYSIVSVPDIETIAFDNMVILRNAFRTA